MSDIERDIFAAQEQIVVGTAKLIKLGNEMAFQISYGQDDEAKEAAAYAWREATGSLVEDIYE